MKDERKRFICDICENIYYYQSTLKKHKNKHKLRIEENKNTEEEISLLNEVYKNKDCTKSYFLDVLENEKESEKFIDNEKIFKNNLNISNKNVKSLILFPENVKDILSVSTDINFKSNSKSENEYGENNRSPKIFSGIFSSFKSL